MRKKRFYIYLYKRVSSEMITNTAKLIIESKLMIDTTTRKNDSDHAMKVNRQ